MNAIEVIDGGLLTTVQDLGRFGYQRYGVPVSGAMDLFALRAANMLVGNVEGAAGLETTLLGPRLRFLAPSTIAIAGANLGAAVDGQALPRWCAVPVEEGSVVSFDGTHDGIRAYLAVARGLDVPRVLGSRSTYLRSALGGYQGRALKAGDILRVPPPDAFEADGSASMDARRDSARDAGRTSVLAGLEIAYGHDHVVRVVLGPQDDRFTANGVRTFLSSTYTVTPQCDRMGYRLAGPRIEHAAGADIVSDGTPLGAVQVAGDGMPIVLMSDRGTAGGYTKIATVIGADIGQLAQAAAGDTVRFVQVTLDAAHAARREREALLDDMRRRAAAGGHSDVDRQARRRKAAAAAAAVARLLRGRG